MTRPREFEPIEYPIPVEVPQHGFFRRHWWFSARQIKLYTLFWRWSGKWWSFDELADRWPRLKHEEPFNRMKRLKPHHVETAVAQGWVAQKDVAQGTPLAGARYRLGAPLMLWGWFCEDCAAITATAQDVKPACACKPDASVVKTVAYRALVPGSLRRVAEYESSVQGAGSDSSDG